MPLCAPYRFNLAFLSLMQRRKRMDLSSKGRRALVTGSSSGLGEAKVKMLAQEGAAVVVHGRDSVRVDVIVKAISDAGGRADRTLTTDAGADKVCGSASMAA